MFGMGASEILVILVVALLFLGPEKLPEAAQKISRGIRDLRSQTRELQQTLENDSELGGALRDLKSALRGDEPRAHLPPRPRPVPPGGEPAAALASMAVGSGDAATPDGAAVPDDAPAHAPPAGPRLPESAGEPDAPDRAPGAAPDDAADDDLDVAALIRPAGGTVAKGGAAPDDDPGAGSEGAVRPS